MVCCVQSITLPALAVSAIVVAAYKKCVLVSLLVHGKAPTLPKFTSSVVHRHLTSACPEYTELATLYNDHDVEKVRTFVQVLQHAVVKCEL